MKELIIVISSLLIFSCKTEEVLYSVELEIYPAFHDYSKYKIEASEDTTKMTFNLFELPKTIEIALSGKETNIKEEVIVNPRIKELFLIVKSFEDDGKRNFGFTDGISSTITRNYKNKSDTISIHVPFRDKNPIHFAYLDVLFEILMETDDYQNQIYFETIKSYFDYGLPITKTNDRPITYRLWGSLTTNEEEDLNKLLKTIKDDDFVIFDFRNYQGMGSLLYHEFIELNKRNPNTFYWYDKKANEDIIAIGSNRIFGTIEEILTSQKNGYR